jgi:hypothetical protein
MGMRHGGRPPIRKWFGTRGTFAMQPAPIDNLIRLATQAHTRLVRDFGVGMAGRVSRSDAAGA